MSYQFRTNFKGYEITRWIKDPTYHIYLDNKFLCLWDCEWQRGVHLEKEQLLRIRGGLVPEEVIDFINLINNLNL